MDVYNDYEKYIFEKADLINQLKKTDSPCHIVIGDVLKVLNYVCIEHKKNAKLDDDLEEIFDIGFTFITNTLDDYTIYYNDYFKKDIILFNKYGNLIFFASYLEDLKGYLEGEELYDERRKALIEGSLEKIDHVLANREEVSKELSDEIETNISEAMPKVNHFRPVYEVFQMISEELDLLS